MIHNYLEPITNKDIDLYFYTNKFKYVNDYFKSKTSDDIKLCKIFFDPTMFSYTFFRLDGQALSLYPYQDLIANDVHRFIYFRASNQIGKSLLLDVLSAYNLIIDHRKSFVQAIVSKSLPQASEQMRRIKMLLNTAHIEWKESRGISDSMSVITVDIKGVDGNVVYTNTLVVAPCTEGLLGFALDRLYLDEFEFWDIDLKYFYNQIAEPRTYKTKGHVIIFSNPNGSESYGAELERLTFPDGTKKFHTYVFNYLDCPGNTKKDLELAKVGKTRAEIESTLLAIRSISSKNFFTADEIDRSYDKTLSELSMIGKQPIFFLDVGAKHDASVLVGGYIEIDEDDHRFSKIYLPIIHKYPVGYPITRVAGVNVDDSDGWHYEKSVKEYLEEWSVNGIQCVFGYDVTGNAGMKALFEAIGVFGYDITFSGPSKSGMYQRFKYFMEKGLLHRIRHKDWEYEAGHLIVKKSLRGYLMVHHETEDDRDDCCDATAGMIHLSDPNIEVQPSLTII